MFELKGKVAEAATECALGELSLSERKAYDAERRHRILTGGKPGALETQVGIRSSEIMIEAYDKVDRALPPGDLKKVEAEQQAIAKWNERTIMMTAGGRSASMPETPASQFREQSVLDRLENHHVQKQKY